MNILSTKHFFILSACLLPLLTQCGDGGKTIEELYTDKRPNDFVKVTPSDIQTLKSGNLISLKNTEALPTSILVTMTGPNSANVIVTTNMLDKEYNSADVVWVPQIESNNYTLTLTYSKTLHEEVVLTLDLGQAASTTSLRAAIPGKVIEQKAPDDISVLKPGGYTLLEIDTPTATSAP